MWFKPCGLNFRLLRLNLLAETNFIKPLPDKGSISEHMKNCYRLQPQTYTYTVQTMNKNFTRAHIQIIKQVLIIISYDTNANSGILLFHDTRHRMSKIKPNVSNKDELNSQLLQMGIQVQVVQKMNGSICHSYVFEPCWNPSSQAFVHIISKCTNYCTISNAHRFKKYKP